MPGGANFFSSELVLSSHNPPSGIIGLIFFGNTENFLVSSTAGIKPKPVHEYKPVFVYNPLLEAFSFSRKLI